MKRVSPYLKMRVLGAIEYAPGNTNVARIKHVSSQAFLDEEGQRHQFTWRTIQTWYSRYKQLGITTMTPKPRSDRGLTRKVSPEYLLTAIEQVRPSLHGKHPRVTSLYRACIERGLLVAVQIDIVEGDGTDVVEISGDGRDEIAKRVRSGRSMP